ncbi:MAG: hypothetical protein JW724_02775 [Candidatus Altiarchaeota archaeon]|nr:hypothetical protein [Candidatus Altiarchaeota archaeon]
MKTMRNANAFMAAVMVWMLAAHAAADPFCPGSQISDSDRYPREPGNFTAVVYTFPEKTRFVQGDRVSFEGRSDEAKITELWIYAYSWTSSRDGPLSEERFFTTNNLSVGEHVISFNVVKVNYRRTERYSSTASISVRIDAPPIVLEIESPRAEKTYPGTEDIEFIAKVSGGIEPYSFEWESERDGVVGKERTFKARMPPGLHEISLKVTDGMGRIVWADTFFTTASRTEEVLNVSIASPSAVEVYRESDPVDMIASVSGGTGPYVHTWRLDGVLVDRLSSITAGEHVLAVEATDSEGSTAGDSVRFQVNDACNKDGICETVYENCLNCPQDCPSGSMDRLCDGIADGICDPDCGRGDDPDCACNKDGICETVHENYLNCPLDCPSGSSDGCCDGQKDGICDPDCGRGDDADCAIDYPSYLILLVLAAAALIFYMRFIRRR